MMLFRGRAMVDNPASCVHEMKDLDIQVHYLASDGDACLC